MGAFGRSGGLLGARARIRNRLPIGGIKSGTNRT